MAHIEINTPHPDAAGDGRTAQVLIDGHDVSRSVFIGMDLCEVGDDEWAELGLRLTFALSDVTVNGKATAPNDLARKVCEPVMKDARDA